MISQREVNSLGAVTGGGEGSPTRAYSRHQLPEDKMERSGVPCEKEEKSTQARLSNLTQEDSLQGEFKRRLLKTGGHSGQQGEAAGECVSSRKRLSVSIVSEPTPRCLKHKTCFPRGEVRFFKDWS